MSNPSASKNFKNPSKRCQTKCCKKIAKIGDTDSWMEHRRLLCRNATQPIMPIAIVIGKQSKAL